LDGRLFIIFHQATVADYIGAEDCGEFTLKTFICHMAPPFLGFKLKNSVCGTFEGAQKSDEKSDSIQFGKLSYRSDGIGGQKLFKWMYTQINGF
jgi:hypothetical protein